MKKEARILFYMRCPRGYAFVVYRRDSIEEVGLSLKDNIIDCLRELRTIDEVRYFYCINCDDVIPGALGIRRAYFSQIAGLLEKARCLLEILCCIASFHTVKTIASGERFYVCRSSNG